MQVELNARAVLEHLEADGDLSADELLLRVDADIQMIEEQIVVGAIRAVLAAQDVGMSGSGRLSRRLGRKGNRQERGQRQFTVHEVTLSQY